MNKQRAGLIILGTLSASVLVWGIRSFMVSADEPANSPAAPVAQARTEEKNAAAVSSDGTSPVSAKGSQTGAAGAEASKSPVESLNPGLAAALDDYAKLKQKVLLNPEATAAKAKLLQDEKLLAELKAVFSVSSQTTAVESQTHMDTAVDFLLDARAAGSDSAAAVLRSVIEDERIEQESLPMDQRSELAEIKAEVMYRWSSQEPERTAEIEKLLPGPVSKKIWGNVLAAQKQNQLESIADAARHH